MRGLRKPQRQASPSGVRSAMWDIFRIPCGDKWGISDAGYEYQHRLQRWWVIVKKKPAFEPVFLFVIFSGLLSVVNISIAELIEHAELKSPVLCFHSVILGDVTESDIIAGIKAET